MDIATVDFLIDLGHRLWPEFDYRWLVDEMKRNLPQELDFLTEASNAQECRDMLARDPGGSHIIVPKVYNHLSTPQVRYCTVPYRLYRRSYKRYTHTHTTGTRHAV